MKKIRLIIALLLLFPIFIFLLSFNISRDPVQSERDMYFDQLSLNGNGLDSITDIFCYTYKDENENEHHYMLMPSSADLRSCIIKFLYADHVVITNPDGSESRLKSNSVVHGLNAGDEFKLRFEDADDRVLREGILNIIQAEELPAVFIDTFSGNMDEINSDRDHRESGTIFITDEKGNINTTGKLEYIKGHGNTSWEMIKKAYQFKLKNAKDVLQLGASKKWVLIANYDYASEEKNALVYDMAQHAGLKGTPEFKFTELYFNGQYQGMYLLGGKIESGKDRLDIADLEHNNKLISDDVVDEDHDSYLRKGEYLGYDIGGNPADITGGFILERDYSLQGKLLEHASRFTTLRGDTYGIKEPYIASIEEAEYIYDFFQELEDRIYNGEDISDIADIESFANKYLLEELIKNSAGGSTSTYFYKDSDKRDAKIHAGPAWDYDKSLGNTRINLADDPTTFNLCTIHPDTSYLFSELYLNSGTFRELVRENYIKIFRPYIIEAVSDGGMLDRITGDYAKDNGMDAIRWSKPDTDYLVHAQWVRDFLKTRLEYADRLYINGEVLKTVKYTDEYDSLHIIGVLSGECIQKFPFDALWYDEASGEEVTPGTPVEHDMVLNYRR